MTPAEIRMRCKELMPRLKKSLGKASTGRRLAQELYKLLEDEVKGTKYEAFSEFEKTLYNALPKAVQEETQCKRFWELVLKAHGIEPVERKRGVEAYDDLASMIKKPTKRSNRRKTK